MEPFANSWRLPGNNVTSGILGLAYPSLTNAYSGNDLDGPGDESILYSPVFTSMVTNGLVEPYFAIASMCCSCFLCDTPLQSKLDNPIPPFNQTKDWQALK